MLHIILFVLKILGWILLAVLGLLVLVFLLVLFTPLRYQVEARCKGKLSTLEAGVRFHLFFHFVSGHLCYEEQKLAWKVRAAWIKLGNGQETAELEETKEADTEISHFPDEALQETSGEESKPGIAKEKPEEAKPDSAKEKLEEESKSDIAEEKSEESKPGITEQKLEEDTVDVEIISDRMGKTAKETAGPQDTETKEAKSSGADSVFDKLASVFEKIKYTFSHICDKIKALWKKVEEIKAFLEDDTHQSAFWKLIAEIKKLLFRMRPKQVDGKLEFGFEDPSLTGRVLAVLSMLYPYWEVQLYPNFERKVLDGSVSVKGSARLWPAAVLAWNLLWNRDVRRTVMDIKKMIFK